MKQWSQHTSLQQYLLELSIPGVDYKEESCDIDPVLNCFNKSIREGDEDCDFFCIVVKVIWT